MDDKPSAEAGRQKHSVFRHLFLSNRFSGRFVEYRYMCILTTIYRGIIDETSMLTDSPYHR